MHTSDDAIEAERQRHVRPPDWRDPVPAPAYDLIAIGGGTAGLVCAMGAAGLGARVALIEQHRLGGDCLNTGCVPSKGLIRSARVAAEVRHAAAFGVSSSPPLIDSAAVLRRLRARRAAIAPHDGAARLRDAGVDVFFGSARFLDASTLAAGETRLRFRRAVIATGARPSLPPVPGLESIPLLTSDSLFELPELPRRLAIVGAGPIGCELAQALARLGTAVTLIEHGDRVLPREDADASAIVQRRLEADGVTVRLGARVNRAEPVADWACLHLEQGSAAVRVMADAVFVATGRLANVDGLALDAAGIATGPRGVRVDDFLRTTNRRVYASGDVCGLDQFTHAADALSRLVLRNALFFGRGRVSRLVIPRVTYTAPEVAFVGVPQAGDAGLDCITVPLADIDRAMVDDETEGFVRVHHARGRLRACTIVAPHAGEVIAEAVYALTHGGTLGALSSTVHPYPTTAEALRKAGDRYRRQALTAGVRRWLTRYFAWTR